MIIPYFELYSVSVKLGSRFITKIATWSRVFWWEIMQVENTKERFRVCNVGAAYKFIGTWLWMSTKQCWDDQNTSDCCPSREQKKNSWSNLAISWGDGRVSKHIGNLSWMTRNSMSESYDFDLRRNNLPQIQFNYSRNQCERTTDDYPLTSKYMLRSAKKP